MDSLRQNNIKKAFSYLARNGVKQTFFAIKERTEAEKCHYTYTPPCPTAIANQRAESTKMRVGFSIVVPLYNPAPRHFQAMVESVLAQSYPHFELILADAGKSEEISSLAVVYEEKDERVKYHHLGENKGIAGNTNAAVELAAGEYVGLLDHDDLLTVDALFEMNEAITKAAAMGTKPQFLYSDEDKVSAGDSTADNVFFEPHHKPGFNLDLLLSNNYICHFLIMRRELISWLRLRADYDGAQDYDLVLRAVAFLLGTRDDGDIEAKESHQKVKAVVSHIGKVLYHWRSHSGSTATNPASKMYAYEAGRRAVWDFIHNRGYKADVVHLRHLGFYRVNYHPDILANRPEVGVVGGKLLDHRRKVVGGIYDKDGNCIFADLHSEYSGYMRRASLVQEAYAVDVRCMKVSPLLTDIYAEFCADLQDTDCVALSLRFCETVRALGYIILWDPQMTGKLS
ncbi:MAG: glycosyltransferase [Lachnospiraceae bacterium]|jgi:glycosyltransferase involved in cell wall biosynthesis|nr:glycosyltransferase [Lachnospiraceae bacterium]